MWVSRLLLSWSFSPANFVSASTDVDLPEALPEALGGETATETALLVES